MDDPRRQQLDLVLPVLWQYGNQLMTEEEKNVLAVNNLSSMRELATLINNPAVVMNLPGLSMNTRAMLMDGGRGSGQLVSQRWVIEQPLAEQQSVPRPPGPKTRAARVENLSDQPEIPVSALPSTMPLPPPRAEDDVKGNVSHQFSSVNLVSTMSGPGTTTEGARGGASVSQTDLLLREPEQGAGGGGMAADRARVSSVLEVKADWQVELDPADTWESMTRDEAKMKEIMPGLQQAWGYAVKEQVALVAVTTYKFTIYMMRAPLQYGPKALLISDPIWWNQQNPSARACMLHFMSLAHERFPEKQQLAEAQVPATIPPGHRWLRSPGDWPWRAPTAFLMNARRYSINGIERLSNDLALQLAEALGLGGGNAEAADQPAENPAI
ncbi:g7934 [Coccomyxa viridis]|uniref:G7934 protein n=1 Tax=Coccomyxa viridis TaxID=1274662 RepID=A0ABP1G1P5_9CHLO